MNYDALTVDYRQSQVDRIVRSLQRLGEMETTPGRVIPEAEDLVIGDGRRLNAATMFVDISGFSSWPSETADEQKAILAILNVFFTEMVRIAEDYGGTVEKNTGDGLMAYFEDRAGDEGSKRAVACALTMLDTNTSIITTILSRAQVGPISFRIAIDHGPITVGRLGAARRFNAIVAVGTSANIASKMLSVAQAGELVIGATVRSRLPGLWQNSWTQIIDAPTGWVYRMTGLRYPFYRYTGRWTQPLLNP
jgi:class 3 adenylate cyclase